MTYTVIPKPKLLRFGVALVALAVLAHAQTAPDSAPVILEKFDVTAKREHRTSKGATNLPLTIKDTPQSISTIDQDAMRDFATTDTNDALRLGTGLTVDAWETNRTSYSARGFDIMLTQVDGLGMTNDWGLVVGQEDTYYYSVKLKIANSRASTHALRAWNGPVLFFSVARSI